MALQESTVVEQRQVTVCHDGSLIRTCTMPVKVGRVVNIEVTCQKAASHVNGDATTLAEAATRDAEWCRTLAGVPYFLCTAGTFVLLHYGILL